MEIFNRKNNLSVLAGDPKKAVKFIFWPMLITYIIVAANTYLDTFWAAGLGPDAAGAVNVMADIYACIAAVGAGMGVACAAVIAYHLGDNNPKRAELVASHSILVCIAISVAVGVIMFLLVDPLIDVIGIQDLRSYCHEYIMPIILCNVLILVNGALCGILRAEGASYKSMIATFILITSAFFDPLFIIVLDTGVAGAAWGTIASVIVSTAYLTYVFAARKNTVHISFRDFKFDRDAVKELLFISVPYGMQNTVRKIGSMLDRAIVIIVMGASLGSATIAVYCLPWTYIRVLECFGLAFGAALIPVLSFNIGRRDRKDGQTAIDYTLKSALIWTCAASAIVFVLSGPLMRLLTMDSTFDEYRDMMSQFLMIVALTGPIYAVRDVSFNILQTVRKNNLCIWITFGQLILRLVFMYLGGVLFGPLFIAIGNMTAQYMCGIFVYLCARFYWNKHDVERITPAGKEKELLDRITDMSESKQDANDVPAKDA